MGMTRVDCLKIDTFRRFRDITIPFGDHVTIIAGQNGTSKSTLLGMLAQPFSFGVVRGRTAGKLDASSYTDNYHGLKLHTFKDLAGKSFMYDCDDVFRLSREFDFGKKYQYKTELSLPVHVATTLPDNSLLTKSRDRKEKGEITGMRFVTGPRASHKPGEGNFPHPVIYLGLNRLWPLAKAEKCTFSGDALSAEDKKWYVKKYNEILCLDEDGNDAKFMDTTEKRKFITPHSSDYDGESCSAGQDNLSQILTAILSFRGLKKRLGARYQGGMLLVDELDATLHAYSQARLLELLYQVSHELDLQVIATSHSLYLLKQAYRSAVRNDVEVLYLENKDGRVSSKIFPTYENLADYLKVQATLPTEKQPPKVSVVFEDENGQAFFNHICGSKLHKYVARGNTSSLGAGKLKNLADMSKQLPMLKTAIFVTDGDMADTWESKPRNLLVLPGGARPETVIYYCLFQMGASDPFWDSIAPDSYTRQFAMTSQGGTSLEKGDDKDWVKDWYRKQSQYWGRGNQKAFKSWIKDHKEECLEFCKKFVKLLKGRYRGEIPRNVIDRVLAEFKKS
jgi:predicted ATPase